MTQAERVHSTPPTSAPITTTRRQFSKWLAGLAGAVATPAAAVAAAPPIAVTADWQELGDEYRAVLDRIFEVNARIKHAERTFKKWERRNPWPPEPDYLSREDRIADFPRLEAQEWRYVARYAAARVQCGVGRHRKVRRELQGEFDSIEARIAAIPVQTLADARAKARLGAYNVSGLINRSLSEDLIALSNGRVA